MSSQTDGARSKAPVPCPFRQCGLADPVERESAGPVLTRFTPQPARETVDLTAEVGGGAGLVGREQDRAAGGEPFGVVTAPEAFVADHDLGGGAGEQVSERLVLLSLAGTTVYRTAARARRSGPIAQAALLLISLCIRCVTSPGRLVANTAQGRKAADNHRRILDVGLLEAGRAGGDAPRGRTRPATASDRRLHMAWPQPPKSSAPPR